MAGEKKKVKKKAVKKAKAPAKTKKPAKAKKAVKAAKAVKAEATVKAAKPAKTKKARPEKPAKPEKAKQADKPQAVEASKAPKQDKSAPRLQLKYEQEILPGLSESLGRSNRHSLPRLEKIVISMGVGSATSEKKHLDMALSALTEIAGQKPAVRRATKSVAGFRLREGSPVGCMVTLRAARMYEFLDRLIALALPRVRDFRGLNPKAFDGHGNYSLGLSEQLVFPELNPDKYPVVQGMNVTLVTSTDSNDEAKQLLLGFGLPLQSETQAA